MAIIQRTPPNFDDLSPVCRNKFRQLQDLLTSYANDQGSPYVFTAFEIYRSPERQAQMVENRTSKAPPWSSPHQWGFAVDFVPRYIVDKKWSWDDNHEWDVLMTLADECGLEVPIAWDLAHVQAPEWREARIALRKHA